MSAITNMNGTSRVGLNLVIPGHAVSGWHPCSICGSTIVIDSSIFPISPLQHPPYISSAVSCDHLSKCVVFAFVHRRFLNSWLSFTTTFFHSLQSITPSTSLLYLFQRFYRLFRLSFVLFSPLRRKFYLPFHSKLPFFTLPFPLPS
jgi:hypothetical protein